MTVVWLAVVGAAGWMIHPHTTHPELLAVLGAIGLVAGLLLARGDKGALRWVCGFGVGIDLMLAAWFGHAGSAAVPVAVAGCALVIVSLVGAATGKGKP